MKKGSVDTTRLQRYARAYAESATFYAALDLELFSHVSDGAVTIDTLAAAMDVTALNAERLVTACLAMDLLGKDGGKLRNAEDAERYLVKGKPNYAKAWMTFTRPDVPEWFRLTDHLRNREQPTTLGMYADLTVEDARAYHAATYSIGLGAGKKFAREVDLSSRRKLLDLGGGSGAYSIAATRAFPNLEAVVLDLPPVIEVTRDYLRKNGVEDRVGTQAGDFTRDPLPDDADVIVMASNLPIYGETVIQHVVERAYVALLPGGEMHLVGEMIYDDRSGPLDAALWGMNEALNNSGGKAHTISQCRGYFEAAGFTGVTDTVFVPGVLHRVTGIKSSSAVIG
jgi:SAM-dependent methyltransferase